MIDTFKAYLDKTNLSENSKSAYLFALRQFTEQYGSVTKKNLTAYKVWLVDHFKPQTVNLRLRGMNCYLESVGKEKWKLSFVKVQQKPFLENCICRNINRDDTDLEPHLAGPRTALCRAKTALVSDQGQSILHALHK